MSSNVYAAAAIKIAITYTKNKHLFSFFTHHKKKKNPTNIHVLSMR